MNIFDFDSNLIRFTTKKIISGKVVWVDSAALDKVQPNLNGEWNEAEFLDYFGYVIEGNQHFEEIEYAIDIKDMYAEIYGGSLNGGSGRTGNLGQFQVKGVGQTMLVGKRADSWHSYGCFSLVEALLETVNSVVLNEILPCGTAKCFGLILTGEQTAWPPNSDVAGRGALLVRESCLRPAHFFYNDKFSPKTKYKHLLLNDKLRIKKITNKLSELVGGATGYEEFLKKFLNSYANQFAYAKLFRIYHGAINSSNVSLDGKWMDLTTASFIDSGKNYIFSENIPSFNAEHCTVLNFVEKLIDVYKIHSDTFPEKNTLVTYYVEKFKFHLQNHVLTLLGLNSNFSRYEDIATDRDFSNLVDQIWSVILSGETIVKEIPEKISESDPFIALLEEWFSALNRPVIEAPTRTGNSSVNFVRFFNKHLSTNVAKNSYFKYLATIRSLKKALFSEFFFKKRIEKIITQNINTDNIGYFTDLIEDCKNVATWAFNDSKEHIVIIYSSTELKLLFDSNKGTFEAIFLGENMLFHNIVDFVEFVKITNEKYFIIAEYSFKNAIIRMCDVIYAGRRESRNNVAVVEINDIAAVST